MSKSKRRREQQREQIVYREKEWESWFEKSKSHNYNLTEDDCKRGKINTNKYIKPKTVRQREFIRNIKNNFITFGVGYAGTGKTLLALHTGISLFNNEESNISKILYVRPNVDANFEKSLGALPGELQDKTMFMKDPIIDNLLEFMTESTARMALQTEKIEVRPVNMLRGRSLADAIIIVEEAQNIPLKYLSMLITRASHGSKVIIIGDTAQIDLNIEQESGLDKCITRLKPLEFSSPVAFTFFNSIQDIQRNQYLSEIIVALNG